MGNACSKKLIQTTPGIVPPSAIGHLGEQACRRNRAIYRRVHLKRTRLNREVVANHLSHRANAERGVPAIYLFTVFSHSKRFSSSQFRYPITFIHLLFVANHSRYRTLPSEESILFPSNTIAHPDQTWLLVQASRSKGENGKHGSATASVRIWKTSELRNIV